MEGLSDEGHLDLEEYVQLVEDMRQRCSVLQHDLREYMDAVVHRCGNVLHQRHELLPSCELITPS